MVVFTNGWYSLRDFYDLEFGGWVTLVFVGRSQFGINVKDRLGMGVNYPNHDPLMRFIVYRDVVPLPLFDEISTSANIQAYQHEMRSFRFSYIKKLTRYYDVTTGFLVSFG